MKKFLLVLSVTLLTLLTPITIRAAEETTSSQKTGNAGFVEYLSGAIAIQLTGAKADKNNLDQLADISDSAPMNLAPYLAGRLNAEGEKAGLLPAGGQIIASLYQTQPSSREYFADVINNMGLPTVSQAYAQGTGYSALSPFLPFWKVFRNLAYSLYIIMFVVVGIMIMLRTKVNAQTIITIQSALPNLLITLLLITFSYAIVGFMIDLMYFLIYFLVYLMSAINIIETPLTAINRLMSYSSWGIVFEGRNSIVSAVSLAIGDVLSGLGTGGIEAVGTVLSWITPMYLVVAVYMAIQMIKLLFALIQSYVMIIVQLVTAPLQILMNAMPGSKAFSNWLKKTASYIIPFPVAAAMFIFSAVLIGDPTKATIFRDVFNTGSANPFGINQGHEFYSSFNDAIWLPPFTLTGGVDFVAHDVMILIGFVVFTMTPSAVKMAQEWLQVKESPYAAEAFQGFVGIASTPAKGVWSIGSHKYQEHQQRKLYAEMGKNMRGPDPKEGK